jgi:hypothetical protein
MYGTCDLCNADNYDIYPAAHFLKFPFRRTHCMRKVFAKEGERLGRGIGTLDLGKMTVRVEIECKYGVVLCR